MIYDDERGAADQPADPTQSGTNEVSRRKALGRLVAYTAPAMLALLVSEESVAQSATESDIRAKRDVTHVTRLPGGLNLYRYRYLWSDTAYVGVMAHEVAAMDPKAVARGANGYQRVDYGRLGLRLQTWDEWTAAA
jgi:hypothetical protein